MTGNTGGGDNNISVGFDGAACAAANPAAEGDITVRQADGTKYKTQTTESGAGEFYPIAGVSTQQTRGDQPVQPGGKDRSRAGGVSM
ncbi:hypothetical protein Q5752_005099 [Cryptotrichosporon argae]